MPEDDPGCVFCQMIKGDTERPADWQRSKKDVFVVQFTPLRPVTPGHLLFVSLTHWADAADAPKITGEVFAAAAEHGKWVNWRPNRGIGEPESFNLITSRGAEATQTVGHLHVHYIPRREGDGLHLPWTDQP